MAGGHDHQAMVGVSEQRKRSSRQSRGRASCASKAAWSDAASYTMADITMLRTELVIGYVVAGFLAVLVPDSAWHAVFFEGHGFWTTLRKPSSSAPSSPIASFVCSVRQRPARRGVLEGGISFRWRDQLHLRDLITLPPCSSSTASTTAQARPTTAALVLGSHGIAGLRRRGPVRAVRLDPGRASDRHR